MTAGYSRAAANAMTCQAASSIWEYHGQMIPAPAAVALPGSAASTSTTSAPSQVASNAQDAPTMPEPTTMSRTPPPSPINRSAAVDAAASVTIISAALPAAGSPIFVPDSLGA